MVSSYSGEGNGGTHMSRMSIDMSESVRGTAVAKEPHDLVDSLLVGAQVIPEDGSILQVSLRIPLLSMDKERELRWVAQEEYGSIVKHPILISLLRVNLDGKATRVASCIRRSGFTAYGREPDQNLGFLALLVEESRACDVGNVIRHCLERKVSGRAWMAGRGSNERTFENTKGPGALCMDDAVKCISIVILIRASRVLCVPFGNPLAVEVGELLNEVAVLEKNRSNLLVILRAVLSDYLIFLRVLDGNAMAICIGKIFSPRALRDCIRLEDKCMGELGGWVTYTDGGSTSSKSQRQENFLQSHNCFECDQKDAGNNTGDSIS